MAVGAAEFTWARVWTNEPWWDPPRSCTTGALVLIDSIVAGNSNGGPAPDDPATKLEVPEKREGISSSRSRRYRA